MFFTYELRALFLFYDQNVEQAAVRANIHNFINSVKNSLKNITDYHLHRGNMILEKSQEPNVADFQQAIIENDATEVEK